ncbi:MAG: MoxR family ATPase [SAR324 cluster bacterium]|nr:MoxR family ATPase [SAR324 cluster bacterium]
MPVPSASFQSLQTIQLQLETWFGRPSPVIRYSVASILAGGHVLLEDIPGVGKTTFAYMLSQVLGLQFQRIQFTSDLMPSDILGVEIYHKNSGSFEFQPGPIFRQLILADELNRASPKTQSALLQAMTDDFVDIGNHRHPLPQPFIIIATQNPVSFAGTYPLPESQLDRFLVRLSLGYPPAKVEKHLLRKASFHAGDIPEHEHAIQPLDVMRLRPCVDEVSVSDELVTYMHQLIELTRSHSKIRMGISLRGALMWMRLCKALALCFQRDYVIPDDIRNSFIPANQHRLIFSRQEHGEPVMLEILDSVPFPI